MPKGLAHRSLFSDLKEGEILTSVRMWLEGNGYLFWRNALGPILRNGGRQWTPNPMKGFPDLCIVSRARPGLLVACELKREKGGRVSAEQLLWHEALRVAGCRVIVARSLDDFVDQLREIEIKNE